MPSDLIWSDLLNWRNMNLGTASEVSGSGPPESKPGLDMFSRAARGVSEASGPFTKSQWANFLSFELRVLSEKKSILARIDNGE